MKLKIISEDEYSSLDVSKLFETDEFSRSFGCIQHHNEVVLKIAWRSDLLKPDICSLGDSIYVIGIDNNLVIIDSESLNIKVRLQLQHNYLTSIVNENILFIATELEVFLFSLDKLHLVNCKNLPDVFQSVSFNEDNIIIECMDGLKYNLEEL